MKSGDGDLPETSRSEILRALAKFDEDRRGDGRWADWRSDPDCDYAIKHDGRLYPARQIISMATGRPDQSFSGGQEAGSGARG